MIARFGDSVLTGVHLTKLKSDGSGKAGTDADKIMIGPSAGQPILLTQSDGADLIVTEGIEDGLSLALVVRCSVRAAGAAGRIATVVGAAEGFDRVLVAIDADQAGRQAFAAARAARPDAIPLHIAKALSRKDRLDANAALRRYGADGLLAAVEWSLAKASFFRGEISFHGMQREISRANGVFQRILEPA